MGIAKDIFEQSPTTKSLLPNWYRNMNVARPMPMTSTKKGDFGDWCRQISLPRFFTPRMWTYSPMCAVVSATKRKQTY